MVLDIPHRHSTGVQADDHRIEPVQTALALAHQARGEGPGPVPGHLDLKGTHLRVHRLGRGSVPGIAARLGGRLALVVAQVLGQLSGQAPLQGLLDQGRQQTISPGHAHLPGINLLKQAIQSPGFAQLVDHIPPTSRSPVVIISSSHQCQSFHKGLHKPLNTLAVRSVACSHIAVRLRHPASTPVTARDSTAGKSWRTPRRSWGVGHVPENLDQGLARQGGRGRGWHQRGLPGRGDD